MVIKHIQKNSYLNLWKQAYLSIFLISGIWTSCVLLTMSELIKTPTKYGSMIFYSSGIFFNLP